jgi:hypothetical protein
MGDIADQTNTLLQYPDMRALAAHAEKVFPNTKFFLCADEKMPFVIGLELFRFCRRAAPVLEKSERVSVLPLPDIAGR